MADFFAAMRAGGRAAEKLAESFAQAAPWRRGGGAEAR